MKKGIITLLAFLTMIIGCSMTVFASPVTMPDGGVFDPEYYALHNPDVVLTVGIDDNALYQHYKNFGIKEGRLGIDPTVQEAEAQQLRARVDYVANSTYIDFWNYEKDNFTIGELIKIPKNYSSLRLMDYDNSNSWYECRYFYWDEGDIDSLVHFYIMNVIEYATKANAVYHTGLDIENAMVDVSKSEGGLRGLSLVWRIEEEVAEPKCFADTNKPTDDTPYIYYYWSNLEGCQISVYHLTNYNGMLVVDADRCDSIPYAECLKLTREGKMIKTNQYGFISYAGWGSHGGIEYSAPRADSPLYYVYVQ